MCQRVARACRTYTTVWAARPTPRTRRAGLPGGEAPAAHFSYTTPTGWQEQPLTPMRAVNLKVGEASECYVSELGGSGGGLASNLNRWRKQMGQPELSEADIAALPKRTLLGQEASLISISGTFSGMGGTAPKENYRMLGVALSTADHAVFVKLTGPQAEVEKETANFDTFIASLKEGEAPAAAPAAAAAPTAPAAAPAEAAAAPQMPAGHGGDAALGGESPQLQPKTRPAGNSSPRQCARWTPS